MWMRFNGTDIDLDTVAGSNNTRQRLDKKGSRHPQFHRGLSLAITVDGLAVWCPRSVRGVIAEYPIVAIRNRSVHKTHACQ